MYLAKKDICLTQLVLVPLSKKDIFLTQLGLDRLKKYLCQGCSNKVFINNNNSNNFHIRPTKSEVAGPRRSNRPIKKPNRLNL